MPTRRQYSLRVAPLSRYLFTNAAISSALRLRPMPLSQQHSRPTINRGCSDAYCELVECIPSRFDTLRLRCVEKARILANSIPAALDRMEHLRSLASTALDVSAKLAKECLQDAFA